jgi:hypothetical protein
MGVQSLPSSKSKRKFRLIADSGEKGQSICMAHGSFPLLFSRLSRLEFPGSEAIRQLRRVAPPFVTAVFSREGMLTREGRILIRGKFRRLLICSMPPLARHLRAHYGLQGGCNSCGASCNLLFRCPHWDTDSRLCTVYESRPLVCRMFPITPTDLRDRDLVLRHTVCAFHFAAEKKDTRSLLVRPEVKEQIS